MNSPVAEIPFSSERILLFDPTKKAGVEPPYPGRCGRGRGNRYIINARNSSLPRYRIAWLILQSDPVQHCMVILCTTYLSIELGDIYRFAGRTLLSIGTGQSEKAGVDSHWSYVRYRGSACCKKRASSCGEFDLLPLQSKKLS